jgi:hypothetical protein
MADAHKNFAYSAVTVAPSPAASGTSLTVADGSVFPAVPFNATVWPTGTSPLNSNAEIVRVTNIAGNVLTITRTQEGTSARTILITDQIAAPITAKTLTDAELTISDGTNTQGSGTIRVSNANGISFGLNAGTLTASHNGLTTARASNDAIGLNTALTANGVAWTVNSSGLSLNIPAFLTTAALSNHSHGNPQLNLTNLSGTTASNSAGLTLSLSANPAQTVQPGIQSVSAGTTRVTTGEVVWGNANGVSFGANGQTITASHNGLTTARASNDAIGLNTAQSNVTWTVNSAGLSLDARGYAGTGTSATNASVTLNSNGLAISVAAPGGGGNFSAGVSNIGNTGGDTGVSGTRLVLVGSQNITLNQATDANGLTVSFSGGAGAAGNTGFISAGTQTASLGTVVLSNSNGVSFGVNGQTVTASHNGLTTARASNDAVGLNTALTAGPLAWTVNSAGISLNAGSAAGTTSGFAGNLISGSMTHNTAGLNLSLNHPAWLTTAAASDHSHGNPTLALTNLSGTTASNSAGLTLSLSAAAPGAAVESNHVHLLGANTAGNTTASGSTIGWSGIGVTLSGTNASQVVISAPATSSLSATGLVSLSTNGSTISIGVGRTVSGEVFAPFAGYGGPLPFAQSSISLGQNSVYIFPINIEDYLTIHHVRMPVLITNSSSAVSSGRKGETFQFGIYSRNSTNNTVYTQMWSTSYTIAASFSSNASWMLSMITAIGNSTSYNTLSASSAGLNLSASLHGPRELILPVSTLLTPGEYWIALAASTSSSGTVGNVLNISNLAVAYQTYNRPGVSTNATGSGFFQFMGAGTYSATTGELPGGISATQINQLGTLPMLFAATGTV